MSTHRCPGGCGAPVARHLFACRGDWYRLPLDLRWEISATYHGPGGSVARHYAAMRVAIAWYRDNPP
jgi:hypothetical protein